MTALPDTGAAERVQEGVAEDKRVGVLKHAAVTAVAGGTLVVRSMHPTRPSTNRCWQRLNLGLRLPLTPEQDLVVCSRDVIWGVEVCASDAHEFAFVFTDVPALAGVVVGAMLAAWMHELDEALGQR
jgi:hypothetical protein